jgi:hypothetical protein
MLLNKCLSEITELVVATVVQSPLVSSAVPSDGEQHSEDLLPL